MGGKKLLSVKGAEKVDERGSIGVTGRATHASQQKGRPP